MNLQKSSIKIIFIDKSCIFVDEINYLIDMVILVVVVVAVIGAVFALGGVGGTYGKGHTMKDEEKNFNVSDNKFFL